MNRPFELLLFSTDVETIRSAVGGGVAGVVVDWESIGKAERQNGVDTQINEDTADDLRRVRAATTARIVCRINRVGPETAAEVACAVEAGANEILVPMARVPDEVQAVIDLVGGSCRVGFLVETSEAVARIEEFASLDVSRVYVGLVDLSIERGEANVFSPIADGTVERVREAVRAPFGFGGLTLPERGAPIPCRLLIAEMARIGCDFSFLRRSFLADTRGRDMSADVPRILQALYAARDRSPDDVGRDRRQLDQLVGTWTSKNAVT